MDRISKALEMARGGQAAPRAPHTAHGRRSDASPIEYTRTLEVKVSPRLLESRRVLNRDSDPRAVDAYRLLRTRVLHRMRQNNWVTLGVTSPGAREGKTLTTVNLGISIAREVNHTVLIVDADMRRPAVHTLFGLHPELGIRDHLEGDVPVEHMLVNPGIKDLVLLPGRTRSAGASEHLGSPSMARLVHELRHRYRERIVLFDLPPVLVGDDVVAFAPAVDAMLLVVEEGRTDFQEFRKTVELLDGVNIVGTVLNKSEEKSRTYHEYY